MSTLNVRWLGRISFADALTLQEQIVAQKLDCLKQSSFAGDTRAGTTDELLLLEHEPVYTIGRTPDRSSLLGATHLPHPLFSINRGGQATYHGPGQLVGYPIIDLRGCGQDLHKYLRWLEQILIDFLANYDLAGQRRDGLTGVWIGDRKIASIGVGVRHWVTMHGFALNVSGDLSAFARIVPCGISHVKMTSIKLETGRDFDVSDIANEFATFAPMRFDELRMQFLTSPA